MSVWTHIDCERIRVLSEETEANLDYYIARLKLTAGPGWSPETTALRDLDHSIRVLRLLVAEIQNVREAMIQQEELT